MSSEKYHNTYADESAWDIAGLRALSDGTRMAILRMLLQQSYCVRGLAKQLGISSAAVSQHIKTLKEAKLVLGEKYGHYVFYAVDRAALHAIADALVSLAQGNAGIEPAQVRAGKAGACISDVFIKDVCVSGASVSDARVSDARVSDACGHEGKCHSCTGAKGGARRGGQCPMNKQGARLPCCELAGTRAL